MTKRAFLFTVVLALAAQPHFAAAQATGSPLKICMISA